MKHILNAFKNVFSTIDLIPYKILFKALKRTVYVYFIVNFVIWFTYCFNILVFSILFWQIPPILEFSEIYFYNGILFDLYSWEIHLRLFLVTGLFQLFNVTCDKL